MTHAGRQFKDTIYGQFARIGKAVSSPRRLELLDLLSQGPRTVEVLAGLTGQSMANTSHHLKILREAHLVEGHKQGLYLTCRLADDDVATFWRALRDLGQAHLAEVDLTTRRFVQSHLEGRLDDRLDDRLDGRDQLDRVEAEDLVARMRAGQVTLLDVRPVEEYRAGHIHGATSLPLAELERRIAELPTDLEIVAYCRGPFCVLAVEAVRRLRDKGFHATRLSDGVPEWRARGLAVEATR